MFSSEPALTSANRSKHALKIKGIVFVTHKRNLDNKAGVEFYFNLKGEISFFHPRWSIATVYSVIKLKKKDFFKNLRLRVFFII